MFVVLHKMMMTANKVNPLIKLVLKQATKVTYRGVCYDKKGSKGARERGRNIPCCG